MCVDWCQTFLAGARPQIEKRGNGEQQTASMEWLRWQTSPWGQQTLRGLSWDVAWIAIGVGVLFVITHALLYLWQWRKTQAASAASPGSVDGTFPDRIKRHSLTARMFHWVMAAAMIALLVTGFLPVIGVKFSWVTAHWIFGLVLTAAVMFHMVHATFWQGLGLMWIDLQDLRDGWALLRQTVGLDRPASIRSSKNPIENKLFHQVTALATFVVIGTGLLMMVRVDTPLWTRDPYLLADQTWGFVYLLHGISSVMFFTLIIAHIYFAIRPEKRWLTLSMIRGWIPRERYLQHYDPERWPVRDQKQ